MLLSTLFIALLLKPAEAQCKTSPLWHDDPLNCGDDTVEANCSALFCQWDSITALCKPLTNGGQTDDCSTIQAKDQCDLQPACAFDEPGCSSYKIAKATKDSGFVECTLAPFMDSLTNLFASTSSNYQELTEQEIQIMTTNAICGCTPKYVGALTAVDDCKAYHSAIVQGCRAVLTGFKCGGDFCNVGVTTAASTIKITFTFSSPLTGKPLEDQTAWKESVLGLLAGCDDNWVTWNAALTECSISIPQGTAVSPDQLQALKNSVTALVAAAKASSRRRLADVNKKVMNNFGVTGAQSEANVASVQVSSASSMEVQTSFYLAALFSIFLLFGSM